MPGLFQTCVKCAKRMGALPFCQAAPRPRPNLVAGPAVPAAGPHSSSLDGNTEAQRRRATDRPSDPTTEPDAGEVVIDRLQVQETRGQIRRAMQELPPAQRQILEMMYFDGKTQSVIAEELGLPLGTVKSRTLLGMRRLRALLLEEAR